MDTGTALFEAAIIGESTSALGAEGADYAANKTRRIPASQVSEDTPARANRRTHGVPAER